MERQHSGKNGDQGDGTQKCAPQSKPYYSWKLNAFEGVHLAFYGDGLDSTGFTHFVPIHSAGTGDISASTNVASVGSNGSGSSRSNSGMSSSLHGASTNTSISGAANSGGTSLSSEATGRQDSIKETSEDRTTLLGIESLQRPERQSDTATTGCADLPETPRAGIFLNKQVAVGGYNQVWRGHALVESLGEEETIEVVVKIAVDEPSGLELRQELEAYKILHYHPGIAPRCFGLYGDSTGTTILVLEYCGTALEDFDLDLTTREAIYQKVVELHKAGIVHDDLSPSSILLQDNSTVRIADFEAFWPGHVCPGAGCTHLQVLRSQLEL